MFECVANVSEGRDDRVLAALADAIGAPLLDVHRDADHHRSVFTIGATSARDTVAAAERLASAVSRHVDLRSHDGVHPRLGALDVVPFVALDEAPSLAVGAAREFASWWGEQGVPCFFYDGADDARRTLPALRRAAFVDRAPDTGPSHPHPRLGATAVGARAPLVAINFELTSDDAGCARRIAASVREANGGLPGVRALGFALGSRRRAQVSCNLVDLRLTGVERAAARVRELARAERVDVERVELVGLVPERELRRCSAELRAWAGLDESVTIEHRLAARRASG